MGFNDLEFAQGGKSGRGQSQSSKHVRKICPGPVSPYPECAAGGWVCGLCKAAGSCCSAPGVLSPWQIMALTLTVS